MNKNGPILIIEDDVDDQEIFFEAFMSLNYQNEILFFSEGEKVLDYLMRTSIEPFIIISDINIPKSSGMELREKIHENEDLKLKSIPYLFFTSRTDQNLVVDAYSKSVQGFFIKPPSFSEVKDTIRIIVEYWQKCVSPTYTK